MGGKLGGTLSHQATKRLLLFWLLPIERGPILLTCTSRCPVFWIMPLNYLFIQTTRGLTTTQAQINLCQGLTG